MPERIWTSVLEAMAACLERAPRRRDCRHRALDSARVRGRLASQHRGTLGPCDRLAGPAYGVLVQSGHRRPGDATGERPNRSAGRPDVLRTQDAVAPRPFARLRYRSTTYASGTVDSWLVWQLTSGAAHLCEAGNASHALCCTTSPHWTGALSCSMSSASPAATLPVAIASDQGFGTTSGVPLVPNGTPIVAVLADSHAALFGQGCTDVGTAKATYGTGSSVMAPVRDLAAGDARIPVTLAWIIDGSPTYALREHPVVGSHTGMGGGSADSMAASRILWPWPTRWQIAAESPRSCLRRFGCSPLGPECTRADLRHERGDRPSVTSLALPSTPSATKSATLSM